MSRTPETSALLVTLPGGWRLRVPVRLVRRVEEPESFRRVPLAPRGILGIAEVRGRIVTLLDAGALAGHPSVAGSVSSVVLLEPPYVHLALGLPPGAGIDPPGAVAADGDVPVVAEPAIDALLELDAAGLVAGAAS